MRCVSRSELGLMTVSQVMIRDIFGKGVLVMPINWRLVAREDSY